MDNNYNDFQREINEKIVSSLQRADDALDTLNFMSKFQHLSSINWKWVRSQNQQAELLLTKKAIESSGFAVNDEAETTLIFVPYKENGRRKFREEVRYDINQTNASISDFPSRMHDYQTDEQREILARTLGIAYDEFPNHVNQQAIQIFSGGSDHNNIQAQLMNHVVNRYFGTDTTNEVKPAIESWLAMDQDDKAKINVIDSVHAEAKNYISEIEKELEPIRAEMQAYHQSKINTVQTPNAENEKRERFSFDKLRKDLGLDQPENNEDNNGVNSLNNYTYKKSQGAYNFIKFLDQVEAQHPNLLKSQSVTARGFGSDGLMYDTLTSATYLLDVDLQIEFSGADNVLRVHSSGKEKEYGLLDGSLPAEFDEFKKKVLDTIDALKPKEPETKNEALLKRSKSAKSNFKDWSHAVEAASSADLLKFAEANGYSFKKVGRNRYNGVEHESLTITPSLNRFYYFSGDFGGDTIKFAREMIGITDFKEAVNYINNGDYGSFDKEAVQQLQSRIETYVYDKSKESKNFGKAYRYLTHERKIDPEFVNYFHQNGLIRQDQKGNVIFPYMKGQEIVGAALQGTYIKEDGSTFKHIQTNSDGTQGFNYLNGFPKNLKFFEAPIDMLSYMSLYKSNPEKMSDTWFVAMGGLKECVVQHYFREAQTQLAKVVVNQLLQSVDADMAVADATFKEKGVTPESIKGVLEGAGLSGCDNYRVIEDYVTTNFQSVSVCVDNDDKGFAFEEKIRKACKVFTHLEYFNEIPEVPTEKAIEGVDKWDWNNELKFQIYNLEEQEKEAMDSFVEVEISNNGYIPSDLVSSEYNHRNPYLGMEM